mgnify:CR=1 FL=1
MSSTKKKKELESGSDLPSDSASSVDSKSSPKRKSRKDKNKDKNKNKNESVSIMETDSNIVKDSDDIQVEQVELVESQDNSEHFCSSVEDNSNNSSKRLSRKEAFESESELTFKRPKSLKKKKIGNNNSDNDVKANDFTDIKKEIYNLVISKSVDSGTAIEILNTVTKFEGLIIDLLTKVAGLEKLNSHLLKENEQNKVMFKDTVKNFNTVSNVQFEDSPKLSVAKPIETWSAIIKGNKGETSDEIIKKINTSVGPTLGVRVHDIKKIKSGGAIIRTPSLEECKKIVSNKKFIEEGLNVEFNKKKAPKIKILNVDSSVTKEDLLSGMHYYIFRNKMEKEVFVKNIKIISNWELEPFRKLTVTVEANEEIIEAIRKAKQVYVDWHTYKVRDFDEVLSCYRCHSYDHVIADCHFEERVCPRCCQIGHNAGDCKNALFCRECNSKHMKSDHLMKSIYCPDYVRRLANVKARH